MLGVAGLLVLTVAGSWIAPYDPEAISPADQFYAPSWQHLFGTDDLGKDVFSRVIAGTHYSLTAVAVVLSSALIIGILVGATAGYAGGMVEEILMRITDIFLAFPGILLALAVAAALGPGLGSAMAAIAAVWWPTYARLVRGQVLSIKNNDYVDAARSLGSSHLRIIVVHILRNGIGPVLVQLTLDMGNVLVTFAGLSYPRSRRRGRNRGMGSHGQRRPAVHVDRLVALDVPRSGHLRHRVDPEPAWRYDPGDSVSERIVPGVTLPWPQGDQSGTVGCSSRPSRSCQCPWPSCHSVSMP